MSKVQLRANVILLVSALFLWATPALAQGPTERLPDKDVKKLIDLVDDGRDKFEGNLDGKFKNSTFRGPTGETNISNLLKDYEDNTKKLKDRFNDEYAASAEVAAVLRRAATIDEFMKTTSPVMKGRSEWDAETASLRYLAGAYGATFPLPQGATVRRMNDKETAAAAEAIAKAADRFKDDLDKVTTLAKADKEAAKKDVELLIKQANDIKDHTSDGKPSTAAVRQLVQQAARIQTFVGAHPMPSAMADWQTVQASLGKVQQAFGLTEKEETEPPSRV